MAAPEARSSEASHKGRKLNRSANQLKRNAACLPCRRRRIKCDAVKPHCTSCVRNYHYLKRTQPDDERDGRGVQCNYEEGDSESEGHDFARPVVGKRKEGAHSESVEPPEAVHRLEARVAELQAALHASTSGPNAAGTSSLPLSASGSGSNTPIRMPAIDTFPQPAASNDDFVPNPMVSILHGMPFNMMDTTTMAYNASSFLHTTAAGGGVSQRRPIDELADTLTAAVPPMDLPTSFAASHPDIGTSKPIIAQVVVEDIPEANAGVWQGLDEEAGKLGGPFLELIWPGWPPKLPTPAMLDHLVNVFFTSVPSIPRILHKQMFRSRLSLPPSHVHFPHPALLHAICAVAARYSAAVKIDSVAESIARYNAGFETPEDDIAAISCFAERNSRYAISEMKRAGMLKGRKFFEMLQAQLLVCYYFQQSAKWVDGWIGFGSMARSCVPLGLMHDEEPELSIFSSRRFRRGFMTPVTEDWDREERRAVMYYVICIDASFCSSSAYPGSILTEEVTARFPGSKVEFENGGIMTPNPQTFHSPDLYTDHPVVDPFVMWIKGMVLMHRVGRFTRKLRLPGSAPISQVRFSDEFQRIDRDIQDFNRTFPPSLRDPLQPMPGTTNRIDPDLVAAHLVRRVVGIILHEPFAVLADMNNLSTQRLLINARACSNIVHSVFNSNMDVALMLAPLTPLWLFVAVRAILMFYQHALEIGDRQSAQNLFVEVDVFLRAFEALGKRLAIGAQQHTMLNAMIDELNHRFGIVRPSPSLGPSITILDLNPPEPPAPLAQPWTTAALSNSVSNMPSLAHASTAPKVSSSSNVSALPNLSSTLSNANSPAMSSNSGSHGSPLDAKLLPNPNVTGLNTPFTTSSPPIPSVLRPAQLPANSVHEMAQQQSLQPQEQQQQHQQHQHQQQPAPNFFWANAGSGATTFQDYSGPNLMNLGMRP